MQQKILLCGWKQFYERIDRSVQQKMVMMCSWNQIYATNSGKNIILNFPAKILIGMCKALL